MLNNAKQTSQRGRRLHPAAAVTNLGNSTYQLRLGVEAYTFRDEDGAFGDAVLCNPENVVVGKGVDGGLLSDLDRVGAFVDPAAEFGDLLDAQISHNAAVLNAQRPAALPSPAAQVDGVCVIGAGRLAEEIGVTLTQTLTRRISREVIGADVDLAHAIPDDPATLVCIACDTLDYTVLSAANRLAHARGIPMLFAFFDDYIGTVGPFFIPGEVGCFECYIERRRSNVYFEAEFLAQLLPGQTLRIPELGYFGPIRALAAMTSTVIAGFLSGLTTTGSPDQVLEFNCLTNETAHLTLVNDPRCPTCGRARAAQPATQIRDGIYFQGARE